MEGAFFVGGGSPIIEGKIVDSREARSSIRGPSVKVVLGLYFLAATLRPLGHHVSCAI